MHIANVVNTYVSLLYNLLYCLQVHRLTFVFNLFTGIKQMKVATSCDVLPHHLLLPLPPPPPT